MAKQIHALKKKDLAFQKGFSTENKYRRNQIEEMEEDEALFAQEDEQVDDEEGSDDEPENQPDDNSNDAVYKKRYKDLQSYAARKERDLKSQLDEQAAKIAQLEKQEVSYPQTDEEFEEWVAKYPQVAAAMQTMVLKNSESTKEEFKQSMESLKKEKQEIAYQKAYSNLLKAHPDFDDLRQSDEFNDWMNEQPVAIQNTIFSPSLDEDGVKAAARTVDFFKKDTGYGAPKKKDTSDAAKKVKKSTSTTPDTDDGEKKYSESQIEAMTTQEYEKQEEDILAAQRKGPPYFIYDLSGGAM